MTDEIGSDMTEQRLAEVGRVLHLLRQRRQLTLEQLAEEAGFSVGYLSQVENGTTTPSLSALSTLAAALDTELSAFFPSAEPEKVRVVRAAERDHIRIGATPDTDYAILTRRGLSAGFSALVASGAPPAAGLQHLGERLAFACAGKATIRLDDTAFTLEPGGYLHYSSHVRHSVDADSDVEMLWLVRPAII